MGPHLKFRASMSGMMIMNQTHHMSKIGEMILLA